MEPPAIRTFRRSTPEPSSGLPSVEFKLAFVTTRSLPCFVQAIGSHCLSNPQRIGLRERRRNQWRSDRARRGDKRLARVVSLRVSFPPARDEWTPGWPTFSGRPVATLTICGANRIGNNIAYGGLGDSDPFRGDLRNGWEDAISRVLHRSLTGGCNAQPHEQPKMSAVRPPRRSVGASVDACFGEGFRAPAPPPVPPSAKGRRPKPFTKPEVQADPLPFTLLVGFRGSQSLRMLSA